MKTRRTFSSILIAASLFVAVFICAFFFGSRAYVQNLLISELDNAKLSDYGFTVSFDGIDRGFLYSIYMENFRVSYKDKEILSVESAGLSIGLLDALKIAGGNYNGADVDFSVAEVRLNINQEL
nr:hypothetical protein [Sphaerochaetaceae bacterium]